MEVRREIISSHRELLHESPGRSARTRPMHVRLVLHGLVAANFYYVYLWWPPVVVWPQPPGAMEPRAFRALDPRLEIAVEVSDVLPGVDCPTGVGSASAWHLFHPQLDKAIRHNHRACAVVVDRAVGIDIPFVCHVPFR
jgi:hypothetical protein